MHKPILLSEKQLHIRSRNVYYCLSFENLMEFPVDRFIDFLNRSTKAVDRARSDRKETQLTNLVGHFLSTIKNAKELQIAGSSHDQFERYELQLSTQYSDKFGEHDVSLSTDVENKCVIEVKYARSAGKDSGSQDQIVQPYCYFINDLIYSSLGHLARKSMNPVYVSIAFIEQNIFEKEREKSNNPFRTLSEQKEGGEGTCKLLINPSVAQENLGRGKTKTWPDFLEPTSLERRHLSLALTGGTSAKLLGVFERGNKQIEIEYFKETRVLENPDNPDLYCLFIQPVNMKLLSGDYETEELEKIIKFLP